MRPGNERGFTLIELIMAVAILAVIGAALTESIIIGLRTTDNTSEKLGASSDAQLLTSYFGSDAQSASDVSTTDTSCGGIAPVVRLKWTDPGAPPPGVQVSSYAIDNGTLVRQHCLNGGAPSVQVLVRDVTSVTCDSPCSGTVITLSVTAKGFTYAVNGLRRAT